MSNTCKATWQLGRWHLHLSLQVEFGWPHCRNGGLAVDTLGACERFALTLLEVVKLGVGFLPAMPAPTRPAVNPSSGFVVRRIQK